MFFKAWVHVWSVECRVVEGLGALRSRGSETISLFLGFRFEAGRRRGVSAGTSR